jgi:hypothetical protein
MAKSRTKTLRWNEAFWGFLASLLIVAFGIAAWISMRSPATHVSQEAEQAISAPRIPPQIGSYNSVIADEMYMGWGDSEQAKGWLPSWSADRQERYLAEANRFDDFADRARPWRSGTVLVLPLSNKKYLKFFDEGLCAGFYTCQEHSFEFFEREIGFYFVSVQHGEGSTWLAISQMTGAVTDIAHAPVFSPGGKRAFGHYPSMLDGPIFKIIRFEAERAVVELDTSPPVEGSFKWIDDNSISMSERDKPESEIYVLRSGVWTTTSPNANR